MTFGLYTQGDGIIFGGDKIDLINNQVNFKNGVNSPRSRFYIIGKKWDWFYNFAYDASERALRDFFIRYEEYDCFRVTLGQYKIPYSQRFEASQADLAYLEQSLPTIAFIPGFRIGLQTQFYPQPFSFTLGLYTTEFDRTYHGISVQGNMPLAYNARITFAPIQTKNAVIHLGTAAVYEETDSSNHFIFQAFPEIQTDINKKLVNTSFIEYCKNHVGEEFEAGMMLGSFYVEGEYYISHINRFELANDINFTGYSIGTDFFLTGERYIYDFKNGNFILPDKINSDYGIWDNSTLFLVRLTRSGYFGRKRNELYIRVKLVS